MKPYLALYGFLLFQAFSLFSQDNEEVYNRLINSYLEASKSEKKRIAKNIIRNQLPFDQLYSRLKSGKSYNPKAIKGFIENSFVNGKGIEHPNLIFVPYKYNSTKKYRVKVFLHGAVANLNPKQLYNWINMSDTAWKSVDYISVFPSGHLGSQWWSYSQVENINQLIDFVKINYNVDENNIYLTGISDGASGIFYQANINPSLFSCYLPFIGSMEMLCYVKNKQFYLNNFIGLPFYIVNTRNDQIFDIKVVKSYVDALMKVDHDVWFTIVDTSGHTTKWYPALKDSIQSFIKKHNRNPFPDDIWFTTENPDTIGRKFWVKITKLGNVKGESNLEDFNATETVGVNLFPRYKRFGQIEVHKRGNRVDVLTNNVKKYSLLLSPEVFDFNQPISIYTNHYLTFEGKVEKSISPLLKYNIQDNDRTMLYAAELEITVGKEFKTR